MKLNEKGEIFDLNVRDCIQILQGQLGGQGPLEDLQVGRRMILTLSDPTSDFVRHYDFPVPLQCRKTSDTILLHPIRCRSLSDAFPHVVRTLANR